MKRFISIMLCALLAVCAVVPSFAANTLTAGAMSDAFVGARFITCNFPDYIDDQPQLFNNNPGWADRGGPDDTQPGFSYNETCLNFWGSDDVWQGATYQVKFDAPVDGYYSFAFLMDSGNYEGVDACYVPVRVDDGEEYRVEVVAPWQGEPTAYYGMDNIYLTKGEHIFHTGKRVVTAGDGKAAQYYYGFQYTWVGESGETPDDYSLKASDTLPSGYMGATYVSAAETIGELNEGLNYGIYANTAWPELDGAVTLDPASTFKFAFNVPKDGTYYFAFEVSADTADKNRGFASITVDGEGPSYTAVSKGEVAFPEHEYFTGLAVELEAGAHTLEIQGAQNTPYFHGFYFYRYVRDPLATSTDLTATMSDAFKNPMYPVHTYRFWEQDVIDANVANGLVCGNYVESGAANDFGFEWYEHHNRYNVVTMNPSAKGPYTVQFTVRDAGVYEFRFDFISDDYGRGAFLQVDDGTVYHANLPGPWPGPTTSAYGMQVELEPGTHTFKMYANKGGGCAYAEGFAVTLVELYESGSEGGSEDEIMAAPMNPIPVTGGVVADGSMGANQPLMTPINPLPDTTGAADTADNGGTPPQPYGANQIPAAPGRFGNHIFMPPMPVFR